MGFSQTIDVMFQHVADCRVLRLTTAYIFTIEWEAARSKELTRDTIISQACR
jgi:hypothetical protein